MIAALLLMLFGGLLFVPASPAPPAYACTPTEAVPATASPSPLPGAVPPAPTPAPSPPPPTPTLTQPQRIGQLVEASQVVVVGTIRTIDDSHVLLDVESYTKTNQLTATLTITTHRDRFDTGGGACEPYWYRVEERVLPLDSVGERAVFFLNSYYAGKGVASVGRESRILRVDAGVLYDSESGESLGPADQLAGLFGSTPPAAQPAATAPAPAPPAGPGAWVFIAAGAALLGSALIALGLILRRIKPSKT
ncbi:MAG TPA: hypothetical protein VD886_07020 [Herpetosiphonaceae bacterium]|nr:hypothetical protein [Herpetosiphonaceae bacterium]